jgi:hypothetical protein
MYSRFGYVGPSREQKKRSKAVKALAMCGVNGRSGSS